MHMRSCLTVSLCGVPRPIHAREKLMQVFFVAEKRRVYDRYGAGEFESDFERRRRSPFAGFHVSWLNHGHMTRGTV